MDGRARRVLLRTQWQPDETAGALRLRAAAAVFTRDLLQVKSIYGHSFDHSCILKWLLHKSTCPITNQPLTAANVAVDPELEKRIHAWQIQQTLKQQRLFDDMYEF